MWIKYSEIISFHSYSDSLGLGVILATGAAERYIYRLGESEFAYNLIRGLAKRNDLHA